jgi:2-polyprenyl-6-methoxyphenol hydroxylase-like FAD-dependent oxidoreductase
MRITIAGAGIGGLSLALSLHAAGLSDVHIYERSEQIRGLGVGLNLLPHAVRELTELGLAERLEELGVEPTTLAYYNRYGQHIWSEPRGTRAGYKWPQLSVHRGRLQMLLLDAVRERLGDAVHEGHRLVGVRSQPDGTELATFETASGPVEVSTDVLVGADGIHSALRALRYPAEGAPPWSGLINWRGTAIVDPFLDGATMVMAGDGDQKFVAYPLENVRPDGTQKINFIAEARTAGDPTADWNHPVAAEPLLERFAAWKFPWLDVPAVLGAAEQILEYPMVDRDTLDQWTFGRTTLLGDAAHAMYPNGSNGGSQAILDARTLAFHLATAEDIDSALAACEAVRRPATAALLAKTRQTGPELVMLLAYERAPQGFTHIHDVISAAELETIASDYKVAAGFHPATLNERTSLTVQ